MLKELTYICEWRTCVPQGDYGTLGTKPAELVGLLTDQLPVIRSEPVTIHSASPYIVPVSGIKHINQFGILSIQTRIKGGESMG